MCLRAYQKILCHIVYGQCQVSSHILVEWAEIGKVALADINPYPCHAVHICGIKKHL